MIAIPCCVPVLAPDDLERQLREILEDDLAERKAIIADSDPNSIVPCASRRNLDPVTDVRSAPRRLAQLRSLAECLRSTPRIAAALRGLGPLLCGGFLPGWLILVGAFTSGGKTAFLCLEAIAKAAAGHPVLYVTIELASVPLAGKILGAVDDLDDPNIWIEDGFSELDDILAAIKRWVEDHGGGKTPVVLIDYLQRIRSDSRHSREREVAVACEMLQDLSKRLSVLMIVAAQLNRASQNDVEPQLHHFRESGLAEQTADVALLAWVPQPRRWCIKIGKARWGGEVGEKLELNANFDRLEFGPISEGQRHEGLVKKLISFLEKSGGPSSIAAATRGIRWGKGTNSHPSSAEIRAAAATCQRIQVSDSVIQLLPEDLK